MSDDLLLPQVPEAVPDDPEDVSWALSTAEAMWARGDHSEGIKWIRRAAEAASEAENDLRALHLAKTAADLTNLIARMSRASIDAEDILETPMQVAPPPPPPARPAPPKAAAAVPPAPAPVAPLAPPAAAKPSPGSVTKQVSTPSRPPAPLPSKTSQPPPAIQQQQRGKPLGTNTGKTASQPPPKLADKPLPSDKDKDKNNPSKKPSRRSRDNLDAEARVAAALRPTPTGYDAPTAESAGNKTPGAVEVPVASDRVRRGEIGNNDPTIVGHVDDIMRPKKSDADVWDASPTQDLTGEELAFAQMSHIGTNTSDSERTAVGAMTGEVKNAIDKLRAAPGGATPGGSSPPATVAGTSLMTGAPGAAGAAPVATNAAGPAMVSPTAAGRSDPRIMTSQAVRVVVWRDGTGVHVAPAGTVVSAITVDAVLVALEPNADLTAWLSQRTR